MPLDIPETASQVEARSKADVQRELQTSNPFGKNSWLGATVTASANRIFDFYLQLKAAIGQNFPDTAAGNYLLRWAAIWGKTPIPASKSTGNVVATGVASSIIPSGTVFTLSGTGNYESTSAATIAAGSVSIQDLTRTGTTVTALCENNHGLADNVTVVITGASNAQYNLTTIITVISEISFQYEVTTTPPNEAGTNAVASYTAASIPVESIEFGIANNQAAGTILKLQSPIVGVDTDLNVDYGALGGGSDTESDEAFRTRTLDHIQNPVAMFNVAAIIETAKEVAGVTRVFVQPITPAIGQVTIYFMRDNDNDSIPDASEVAAVNAVIQAIRPANTYEGDVIVGAPTAVAVPFTFTALTPNTATMQEAITASLEQFFTERTDVGVNIDQDAYRSAIFNTVDIHTGDTVQTFTLSAPTGDITIATAQIAQLSTVTYP